MRTFLRPVGCNVGRVLLSSCGYFEHPPVVVPISIGGKFRVGNSFDDWFGDLGNNTCVDDGAIQCWSSILIACHTRLSRDNNPLKYISQWITR